MRRRRYRIVALGLVVTGSVALSWGLGTYAGLVQRQQGLAEAGTWLEAACRVRIDRVDNLLQEVGWFGTLDARHLERVQLIRDRSVGFGDIDAMIDEPRRYDEFRRVQADLSLALAGLWSEVEGQGDPAVQVVVGDLEPALEHSTRAVSAGFDLLERRARAYREDLERFPRALVAAVLNLEAPGFVDR